MFAVCVLRSRRVNYVIVGSDEAKGERYATCEGEGEDDGGKEGLRTELLAVSNVLLSWRTLFV